MRKSVLVLAALMVAATSSAAFAAKKAKAPSDPNWAGKKFAYEASMQPYYAWQSAWGMKPAKKK